MAKSWTMGSRCYGVGEQEWFFIVDESDRIVARVHPAATKTDEETGEPCTGVADYAAIPDVRLMLAAPDLYAALREMAFYFQNDLTSPLAGEMYARVEVALARVDGAASPDPDAETERLIEAHQEDREDWSSKLYRVAR